MTCTQRNSLVFMTSTLIIFLQIQTYSIVNSLHSHHQHNDHNNHYHPHHHHPQQHQQQQHQHLNYTDYNQFTSSSSNNNNNNNHNPFRFIQQKQPSQQQQQQQQSHLRHHHHHPHQQHQPHIPSRNREQVQQHHYQHKIQQTSTNNNATPFRSSGDQIASSSLSSSSSSSTLLNSHESNNNNNNKHYNNKIRIKNQKQHSNVGGINNSDNGVVNYNNKNNNNNNNRNNNKNITLKTHHQSNNKFTDINIGVGNQRYQNDRRSLSLWNRNSLLHHDFPSIIHEDEEGYHIRKPFGSKVHPIGSDRLHQHLNINSTKFIKNLQTTTTSTTQKNWESPRKNIVLQLPKSILKSDQSDLEDYYDEEDDDDDDGDGDGDENDDGEDSGVNASEDNNGEDDENLSDTIIRKNQFNSFQSKFTPAPIPETTTTTTKSIKDVHNDFSYDYLYDEPTNDTDEKSGSLTEEKWRNYGTVEAVEKSRRRHLSEAQIIAAHITRINIEAMCKYPRPKIIQINETSKRYVPHCTVLHRCADDTGCCHSESQTCVAKKTVTVDLHFYAIPLKTKDPIVEVLSFVNHTECHCVDRFPSNNNRRGLGGSGGGGSLTSYHQIPDNNLQFDNKNNLKNGTCNCIRHFDIFEDDSIDDDDNIDYQQTDLSSSSSSSSSTATTTTTTSTKNHSNCRCDCTSDNLTCQRLKRGQEGIPVDDRRCISEGRCILPTCEYGIYNKYLGRCPRAITKRTVNDKT